MSVVDLAEAYVVGAAQLRAAVEDMSREQLIARPIRGKWSTLEVVAHIADFETIMADRIKRVASHDNPTIWGADENLFASRLHYHDRDIEEELAVVDAVRTSTARTIRCLPAEALRRVGTHSEAGVLTLEQWILRATNHIPHHVIFIREKRLALGVSGGGESECWRSSRGF